MSDMAKVIDGIVESRKESIPKIDNFLKHVDRRVDNLESLKLNIDDLCKSKTKLDNDFLDDLIESSSELTQVIDEYVNCRNSLLNLKKRFSRDTINIGVSGEARVGKSTTLQSFSGLDDTQVPTGKPLPVTAVRSEIFNSCENYAIVEFRDEASFIDEYLIPHFENINAAGNLSLSVKSINDFTTINIPSSLGENIDSKASNSLKEVKAAQESVDSYRCYLTGKTDRIDLQDIKKFVAYPTSSEIENGNAKRCYLAVKSVKIYCNFPSLNKESVGLIDLPGLGEIGDSVAAIHTAGLEDEVDQILLILRPTADEGYVKAGIANNIDQLRNIQRGITKRGDLLVAAINLDGTNNESSKTLQMEFEEIINAAQNTDKISIFEFSAIDNDSVSVLFNHILEKLITALPAMDKDSLNYVCNIDYNNINNKCNAICDSIYSAVTNIIKTIPIEDSFLDKISDEIGRELIFQYEDLEMSRYSVIDTDSYVIKDLQSRVQDIYEKNEERITNGLFFSSKSEWDKYAKGRPDYIVFLREDAKRIKAEITDSYREVDVFFDSAISELKQEVLKVFCEVNKKFSDSIGVTYKKLDEIDDNLSKLSSELISITRDPDFGHCFEFVKSVKFKFSQNIFYNIYSSLENLHNPEIDNELGERGIRSSELINLTYERLVEMAKEGNLEIKKSILEHNDQFNKFLFTCMTFFNDFLYRKNTTKFVNDIRIVIKSSRECFLDPDEHCVDKDVLKALDNIKVCIGKISSTPANTFAAHANLHKQNKSDNVEKNRSKNSSKEVSKKKSVKKKKSTRYQSSFKQVW